MSAPFLSTVNHTLNSSTGETSYALRIEHLKQNPGVNLLYIYESWVIRGCSILDFVETIATHLKSSYQSWRGGDFLIRAGTTQAIVDGTPTRRVTSSEEYRVIAVSITGQRHEVESLLELLDSKYTPYSSDPQAAARWWYMTSRGVESSHVLIRKPPTPVQECYPWLPDFEKFFDDYMKSSASVLILSGPAGTGKTSLLRHWIWSRKMRCAIAYDEAIFEQDSAFINFLTGTEEDILIVEDADLLLKSRERAGNKLMSRFLNVSDGLLQFDHKKIVFTTNLTDMREVDPALIRPGRCFGNVHARGLTRGEAEVACAAIGRTLPEGEEFVLADIYNGRQYHAPARRFGFAA